MKPSTLTFIFFLAFAFGCLIGVAKAQTIIVKPAPQTCTSHCDPGTGLCTTICH